MKSSVFSLSSASILNLRNCAPPLLISSSPFYFSQSSYNSPLICLSSSNSDNNPGVALPSPPTTSPLDSPPSASDVVKDFYDGINRHDLASVQHLIADTCVYEDLIFSRPFLGRNEILGFFQKFNDSISMDLQFVIDDISAQDSSAVGVIWHLEWKGKVFPFSKGCSFYRLLVIDGNTQIIYARDSVEPAFKPGELALTAIRAVTWLLEQFPQLADRI